ncbi:uncharacterized protein VTP21DRAFT_3507 [Calcarisporiella thermophila]|uniref:uncharacterized protein n=1 Tax=Calcarisporiella thermophila TaxID=911321 RepID=UPI0037425EB1
MSEDLPLTPSSLAEPPPAIQSRLKRRRSSAFSLNQIVHQLPVKLDGHSIGCLVGASVTIVPSSNGHPKFIYVFGGFHQYTDEVYNDLYRLDIKERRWEQIIYTKGRPPCKRNDHSASYWNEKLIIFGGRDEDEQFCNDIVVLDLRTLTWDRPAISGSLPTGRTKHGAVVYNNRLYITGGCCADTGHGDVTKDLNILDLTTWTWQPPIEFVARYQHSSFAHANHIYVFGGYSVDLERSTRINLLDLDTMQSCGIDVDARECPAPSGQHFAQLCGHKLIVVVTQCLSPGAQEISAGIWALDLRSWHWQQYEDGQRLEQANWHYFAMSDSDHLFYLLGSEEMDDDYFSRMLKVDLHEHGLFTIPPSTFGSEFYKLFDDPTSSDFVVVSGEENQPPIYVHRLILQARWPHFENMVKAGMSEARSNTLTVPEPYETVRAFLAYLYTDKLDGVSTRTAGDLLVLSNLYMMPRLSALCCDKLHRDLSLENVAFIYHRAMDARQPGLKLRCLKYMFLRYGSVVRTAAFRELPKDVLLDFWDNLPESAKITEENN